MKNKIKLGDRVRDTMTGIEGIAFGRSKYLTGCNHIAIKRDGVDSASKPHETHWVDEPLCEIVERAAFSVPEEMRGSRKTGGPSLHSHSR